MPRQGAAIVHVSADGLVTPAVVGTDVVDVTNHGVTTAVPVTVSSLGFADETLSAGTTPIRAIHVTELRTRIEAVRARFGLAAYAWTDSTLTAENVIRAIHITDLRTAVNHVYVAAGWSPPGYTDPSLGAGVTMKAAHITELRAAVVAIE